ncbi:MAG: tRNA (N(6)-L-threonylcarbamoyladenosine(37)-C(2))-methylthiotransferase MtaB [Desulfotomaculaceae bacterium]|nr:tRNA (N(6)-L-threonylcarbamoyladenosine(37)-C(2))-methylthiotransferase MtaB [Desulfotomaculaceae bacterium]
MDEKRVGIVTLGCKVNQYESASLAGLLREQGYRLVDFEETADIYVINTCTVTHLSDRKSRQFIRRATRKNPDALVVVTGCYAQTSFSEIMKIPGVDLVVGTRDRAKIAELVKTAVKGGKPFAAVSDYEVGDQFEEISSMPLSGRTRAFLKIQEGCNNCCTYCIIPVARGPLRSMKPDNVLKTARQLVEAGFKEIVLTGIHTGAYGRDLGGNITLSALLRSLQNIPGLLRVRLSSIEPNDITPELVEVLASSEKFCRHLHVPLQSGDDGVLERMGRRYNTWEYLRLVEVLRDNIPNLGLTTDVIVGFPGEREVDFQNTYRFVENLSYSRLHVFKFSPRRGTPAADYPEQVDPPTREQRSSSLIRLGEKMATRFASSLIGMELTVLVERSLPEADGLYEGLTDNYVRTVFPGDEDLPGQVVKVKIGGLEENHLTGKIIGF